MDTSPKPGDAWAWPDGRRAILTELDLQRGAVTARTPLGLQVEHRIADGGPDPLGGLHAADSWDPELGPAGATFSPCRRFRYALWRRWAPELPAVAFLGLNPSTADERKDDPTIRRCMGFARSWGAGTLIMLNLYAYRSTDPAALWPKWPNSPLDPTGGNVVGPDTDAHLARWGVRTARVIAAWGAFPRAQVRGRQVVELLEAAGARVEVLGLTAQGYPRHPLYARADLTPAPWRPSP